MTLIVPTRIKIVFFAFTFLRMKATLLYYLNFQRFKKILKRNEVIEKEISRKTVSIIGNAPSAKEIDATRLENTKIFCVNRCHGLLQELKVIPDYHVIIDPKIANGTWDLEIIDDTLEKYRETKVILDISWYKLRRFKKYRYHERIFWIYPRKFSPIYLKRNKFCVTGILDTYYVAETCCSISIGSNAAEINLFGIEGDGICFLLLDKSSHYNGKDPDFDLKPSSVANAFFDNALFVYVWYAYTDVCNARDIKLRNLSPRGIIRMMN